MNQHHCHATGCRIEIPPKLMMCRCHWYMVPKMLRDRVWVTYRPGQEIDKNPSDVYMAVQRRCIQAVEKVDPEGVRGGL